MGALWMLTAGLLFGCMGVLVKLGAERHFSSGELVFYRSLCSFLILSAMMLHSRTPLGTKHWRGHLWRGLSGSVGMMLFFYCIAALPLATAVRSTNCRAIARNRQTAGSIMTEAMPL